MTIYPSLRYRDARAAIDWLGEAFGFTEKEAHADEDGVIRHAQLYGGGGIVMLGTEPPGGDPQWGEHAGQGWLYISIDDPDALHDRALAAGATVVRSLQDTDYGSREFSVRDPEGNIWSFGTYAPSTHLLFSPLLAGASSGLALASTSCEEGASGSCEDAR